MPGQVLLPYFPVMYEAAEETAPPEQIFRTIVAGFVIAVEEGIAFLSSVGIGCRKAQIFQRFPVQIQKIVVVEIADGYRFISMVKGFSVKVDPVAGIHGLAPLFFFRHMETLERMRRNSSRPSASLP